MNPVTGALIEGLAAIAAPIFELGKLREANAGVRARLDGLKAGSPEWEAECDRIIAESIARGGLISTSGATVECVRGLMRCALVDEGGPYWGTLGALVQFEAVLRGREQSPEYRDAFARGRREALDLAYRIVGTTTFAGDPWQYIAAVLAQIDTARTTPAT